jgi:hypothetical protein
VNHHHSDSSRGLYPGPKPTPQPPPPVSPQAQVRMARSLSTGGAQPLVVSLNCLDDPSPEQDGLAGVAAVEHVPLSAAVAVLLPSLAFLPCAALVTMKGLLPALLSRNYPDKLNGGFVVALRARDISGYHVARQRVAGGGGCILDVVSNTTNRDPAAQFLVTFKNKVSLWPSSVYSSFIFHA